MAFQWRTYKTGNDSVVDSIVTLFTGVTSGLVIYLLVRDNLELLTGMAGSTGRATTRGTSAVKPSAWDRVPIAAIAGLIPVFVALNSIGLIRRAVRSWLLSDDRVIRADFIATLQNYRVDALGLVERRKAQLSRLSSVHRARAREVGYESRLATWSDLVEKNGTFLDAMAAFLISKWGLSRQELRLAQPSGNVNQAVDVLGHFARDWSSDTAEARRNLYGYVANLVRQHCEAGAQVLVPGSGFCKLAHDIARLGMKTTAIDYSIEMDGGSQYALFSQQSIKQAQLGVSASPAEGVLKPSSKEGNNGETPTKNATKNGASPKRVAFEISTPPRPTTSSKSPTDGQSDMTIAPYMHQFSHQVSGKDQLRTVPIDLLPPKPLENLTVQYGDFRALARRRPHAYDAVVTVFFIDTAENIFAYLDAIDALLKDDGVWINYGPLKWGSAPLAELTLLEIVNAVKLHGWELVERFQGEDNYTGDSKCMWKGKYQIRGWVAKKKQATKAQSKSVQTSTR